MTRHKLSAALSGLALLLSSGAIAQDGPARYERCMTQARQQPEQALDAALAWETEGGGNAARHCAATALVEAGRPGDGATRLDDLAEELAAIDPALAGDLARQAGEAWQLAGRMDRALDSFDRALGIDPKDREALMARAWTRANLTDYRGAVADYGAALALAPDDPAALRQRAAAFRFLGDYDRALADIGRAIAADPAGAEAYLERGNIRRLAGDRDGAEADWRRVVAMAPESPAADAARTNLRRLEEQGAD